MSRSRSGSAQSVTRARERSFLPIRSGKVKHIQAPGNKWASLCSSMTTRVGELFGEMIVLGDFEAARAQDRRCCAACLGKVGSSSKPSAAQWSRVR